MQLLETPLRFIWRRKRKIFITASILFILASFILVGLRLYVAYRAHHQIYTLETVPEQPVAIVFGAWVRPDGRVSAMLADRVKMGAQLYTSGKVKALLLTGDNS